MQTLITSELVALDADLGPDKQAVIAVMAAMLTEAGRATDAAGLVADVMDRELRAATGLPAGIAIPHCRSGHVTTGSLGFARLDPPVDFGAADGSADLVFLIAAADDGDADHLKLLTRLARALVREDFTQSLRDAGSPDDVVALVRAAVAPNETQATSATTGTAAGLGAARHRIVAVTACPTGIAHTYMAADGLARAAEEAGIELHVETQGSSGATPLTADQIAQADAAIFATDVDVRDRGRFAGLPVVQAPVKHAINDPTVLIAEAVAAVDDPDAERVEVDADEHATEPAPDGTGSKLRRWLGRGG